MSPQIRAARTDDAGQVLAIYAPFISLAATSFELDLPTLDEMRHRITSYSAHAPWLVCETGNQLLGYAYATKHRERLAYQWDVEVSVYVHEQARRKGVGRALYTSLFKVLALQGFYNAYAGVTLPNPSSVALHESLGFKSVGVYHRAGYKLGAWHDVGWWQLNLQPHSDIPIPPRKVADVRESPEWDEAIQCGESLLKL